MKKIVLFFMVVFMAAACKHQTDYSPREVNYDRDICAQCLMGIAEQPWAVQAINEHGEVLWFHSRLKIR